MTRIKKYKLPDVLACNMTVVFCGYAVGNESANAKTYYAKKNNMFWKFLGDFGLTPKKISSENYSQLKYYNMGLTDLIKDQSGLDKNIDINDLEKWRTKLRRKIKKYRPKLLVFNGKKPAKKYFRKSHIDYGRYPEEEGDTIFFVLPSTSGANTRRNKKNWWKKFAEYKRNEFD
jgi:double-stranded uracil-DNA glycosylase